MSKCLGRMKSKDTFSYRCRYYDESPTCLIAWDDLLLSSGSIFPPDVNLFDFCASPWRFAKKSKTGFYAWIEQEAADRHLSSQIDPTKFRNEFCEQTFKCNAVKRVFGLGNGHQVQDCHLKRYRSIPI